VLPGCFLLVCRPVPVELSQGLRRIHAHHSGICMTSGQDGALTHQNSYHRGIMPHLKILP
jgi:hypothetical protein